MGAAAAPLSLAATGLSAFGKIDQGNTAAEAAQTQAYNAQQQGQQTQQYDQFKAKSLSDAAAYGKTQAAQTDTDLQMQLANNLGSIMAIRGATGTEAGTTDAAIANRTTEVSDINRQQTVANIQAQNSQDTLAASYYRSAGIQALQIGQTNAQMYGQNAANDQTSGWLGALGTGLSGLAGLAGGNFSFGGNTSLPNNNNGGLIGFG